MAEGMLVAALVTAVVTFVLCLAFVSYTPGALLDRPVHRSSHSCPTPRLGGLAIIGGVVAGALTSFQLTLSAAVVIGCAIALGGVGLLDDRGVVAVRLRLLSQFGIGVIAAVVLASVGMGLPLLLGLLVVPFVMAYVNAFNFMDGVNGISGLNAIVVGIAYACAGVETNSRPLTLLGILIAASAAGFLPLNAPGSLFLGDSGSYFLGTLIALSAVVGLADGAMWPLLAAPLVIYFTDTGLTLLQRAVRGRNLAEAHHEHIYQRLLGGQWGHAHSAVLTAVASTVCCAGALVAMRGVPLLGAAMVASAVVAYVAAPFWVDCNRVSDQQFVDTV